MNKRVLRTMIILCWVFLALYAILKLVPQLASKFVIVVNNEKIVKAGQFIDEREWLGDIIYFLTTLLTYQFYLCACCHKWFFEHKTILSIACYNCAYFYCECVYSASGTNTKFCSNDCVALFVKSRLPNFCNNIHNSYFGSTCTWLY